MTTHVLQWSQLGLLDAFDQAPSGQITLQMTRSTLPGPAWHRMRSAAAVRAGVIQRLIQGPSLGSRGLGLAWHHPHHAATVPLGLRLRGQTVPGLAAESADVTLDLGALLGVPDLDPVDLAALRAMIQALFDQGLQHEQELGQAVALVLRPPERGVSGLAWSSPGPGPDPLSVIEASPVAQAWWWAQQRGMAYRAGRFGGQITLGTLGGSRYRAVAQEAPAPGWDVPSPPAP